MRLGNGSKLAVNILIELALRGGDKPVPLPDLARRHCVSLSYLEQVFAKLRRHQLVKSTRGPGGGYTLGLRGEAITVADVVMAIEGEKTDRPCSNRGGEDSARDLTDGLWRAMRATFLAHLNTISVRSLVDQQRARDVPAADRNRVDRVSAECRHRASKARDE